MAWWCASAALAANPTIWLQTHGITSDLFGVQEACGLGSDTSPAKATKQKAEAACVPLNPASLGH